MSRGHNNRGRVLADDRRVARLLARADMVGRRSARAHNIVLGPERMAALRTTIAEGKGDEAIWLVGRLGRSLLVYHVDFDGRVLAAICDERSRSICSFQAVDAPLLDGCVPLAEV